LKKRKNGPAAWEFRYYDLAEDGQRVRKYMTIGSKAEYPTRASALKAVEGFLLKLNAESPEQEDAVTPTFGAVIERYKQDEMPERYSTAKSYHSMLKNYIMPRWGDCPIDAVKPTSVREWLNALELAP
jgi:hypothetical protein